MPLLAAWNALESHEAFPLLTTGRHGGPSVAQEEANKMLDELSDSIKGIEVDRGNMPLGLSAPMDLVDLDSFVEAVSACVEGDVLERRNSMTGGTRPRPPSRRASRRATDHPCHRPLPPPLAAVAHPPQS